MKKIALSLLVTAFTCGASVKAQHVKTSEFDVVSIGAGIGGISFFGEMNEINPVSPLSISRTGFNLAFERRFGNYFSANLDALFGSVAHSQRTPLPETNLNFESPITQISLGGAFHFDNGYTFKRDVTFAPYIGLGIGMTFFNPQGDLLDPDGNPYYYWEDGTIRNTSEASDTSGTALIIARDYDFETELTDSVDYNRNTLAFPITVGLKWKFSKSTTVRVHAGYVFTQSDYLDNYSIDDVNDRYLFTGVAIHYTIRTKDPYDVNPYEGVDFNELHKADSDDDGVADWIDECPNTLGGMAVNEKGCFVDDDGDGVANHLDKEPESKEGAEVDNDGVTIKE